MSPVIPFRRRSRYPRVPFALGALAAIALGGAAIAAWMIWQRSSVSPSGQIIEVIDGDTVRFNGAVYRLVGFDTPERGDKARCDDERRRARSSHHASARPYWQRRCPANSRGVLLPARTGGRA